MITSNKTFQIYRSSAGSGKTRTLAKEYLLLALTTKVDNFRHILAVTFTNKSTQEMKSRILLYLDKFARGESDSLALELKQELKLDDSTFIERCQAVQSVILHQYSQFAISTIDAFFQKVIRSFTRESGVIGDFRLEVDTELILEDVINDLLDELGGNVQLTRWVVEFSRESLENDKAWDIRPGLMDFANVIFTEEFKSIEREALKATEDGQRLNSLLSALRKSRNEFVSYMRTRGTHATKLFDEHNLTPDDFKYKSSGVQNVFLKASKLTRVVDFDLGARTRNNYQDPANWGAKDSPRYKLVSKLAEDAVNALNEMIDYEDLHHRKAATAEIILNNFYSFALLADISRKLNEYKYQHGLMLLADAPQFLNGIIQDSDTPFIYEKVGSFYKNYLIDEFQDTSGFQWKNFLPLLKNGLDQGYRSVVVGDVKQAVYRWRGGDLRLLQSAVEKTVGPEQVEVHTLQTNYRSARNVVDFNNNLFSVAAQRVALEVGDQLPAAAFADVKQQISRSDIPGYVSVKFLEDSEEQSWRDEAMQAIPTQLEELQRAGVRARDIVILVRRNDEGQEIANFLLNFKGSADARKDIIYDVVSNESLRLDGASVVNLLASALQYLHNAEDSVARAQLSFEYSRMRGLSMPLSEVFLVGDVMIEHHLPPAFVEGKLSLKKLPLVELTETLVEIFDLGSVPGEMPYLLAFQDLVLQFYNYERNDLGAFLEWWEINKRKKSIQLSEDMDAIRIVTIHKSKGLQFGYVLIPFCSWPTGHEGNKGPLMWVRTDEQPLSEIGYVPVKYSSSLKETTFAQYYTDETIRVQLDNLNLLYVALTRAETGMIISAPLKTGQTVAKILYDGIQTSGELKKHWNTETNQFSVGALYSASSATPEAVNVLSLESYASTRWRDHLVIKQNARTFFQPEGTGNHEKQAHGVHMHHILSKLMYSDEVEPTLEQLERTGVVRSDERNELEARLQALLSLSPVNEWFSRHWSVLTEVPILLPGGQENRIDRLIVRERKAIVIDFKTGVPSKADVRQVSDYMNILHQMNYVEVEGYLLYLANDEIVRVNANRSRTVRKRDENQLGLGI